MQYIITFSSGGYQLQRADVVELEGEDGGRGRQATLSYRPGAVHKERNMFPPGSRYPERQTLQRQQKDKTGSEIFCFSGNADRKHAIVIRQKSLSLNGEC